MEPYSAAPQSAWGSWWRGDKVLDPKTYFSEKLSDKLWKRIFSTSVPGMGTKYTNCGSYSPSYHTAELTRRMTRKLVTTLSKSSSKLETFAAAYEAAIWDSMPSGPSMWNKRRSNSRDEWERKVFGAMSDAAFDQATQKIGL